MIGSSSTSKPPSFEDLRLFAPSSSSSSLAAASGGGGGGQRRPRCDMIEFTMEDEMANEELCTFYTIIKLTESIEAAFANDAISREEYMVECEKLISQFKTTEAALIQGRQITSAEAFFEEQGTLAWPPNPMGWCGRANIRLLRDGVPATLLHAAHNSREANGKIISETTSAFITANNALQLDQRAVDDIQPLLEDVARCLNKVTGLRKDFEGLQKITAWINRLHQMRAVDMIEEVDARQLMMELEASHNAFVNALE